MKTLPEGLAEKLESGATTLCWCWRLTRRDGVVLGFTDHDRPLMFDGTIFEAESGLTSSEMIASVGLNVDNLEVDGALRSDRLADEDLAGGVYDDAGVEIFLVDWLVPEDRLMMRKGSLGEVKRGGGAFTAEVRGLAHYLQQPTGRLFQYTCDADLGDMRCRFDLTDPAFQVDGVIDEVVSERTFTMAGLETFSEGWFRQGLVTFSNGSAQGQRMEVKAHTKSGSIDSIELWAPACGPLIAGQGLSLTTGCDKTHATCRNKFGNAVNFQGFPYMPGNDFVARQARSNS